MRSSTKTIEFKRLELLNVLYAYLICKSLSGVDELCCEVKEMS